MPDLKETLVDLDVEHDLWSRFFTVAPLIVAGDSKRIVSGPPVPGEAADYRLDRAVAGTSSLFTRWLRSG